MTGDSRPPHQSDGDDRRDSGEQRRSGGSADAWAIISYILSGLVVWGGIGWLLDRWLGTSAFVPIGALVGFAGAFYLIIRRFGGI